MHEPPSTEPPTSSLHGADAKGNQTECTKESQCEAAEEKRPPVRAKEAMATFRDPVASIAAPGRQTQVYLYQECA